MIQPKPQHSRHVKVLHISKSFEEMPAVHKVTFEAEAGLTTCLLGPSGCGKTTTLRLIAGLEEPDDGEVIIDGERVASAGDRIFVPPERRGVGMVFQSYAIWPHMNVFENVSYPLRIAKWRRNEIMESVERALAMVRLDNLAGRPAALLSGGQQQRVALARALVGQPRVLLLDEPLSNLDAKLREHMRAELKEIQRQLGVTTVYVTHDQVEALALADKVVLMNKGEVIEEGPPQEIYSRPRTRFAADFIGTTNFIDGSVVHKSQAGEPGLVSLNGLTLAANVPAHIPIGGKVVVCVKAESMQVHAEPVPQGANVLKGHILARFFLGERLEYHIQIANRIMRTHAHPRNSIAQDSDVYVEIKPEEIVLLAG